VPVEKRITVNLNRRGARAAEALTERNGEPLTETINRALALLNLVDERMAAGDSLILRGTDGENHEILLL
jgi:hypothetical protein